MSNKSPLFLVTVREVYSIRGVGLSVPSIVSLLSTVARGLVVAVGTRLSESRTSGERAVVGHEEERGGEATEGLEDVGDREGEMTLGSLL
jgi:hypothetical protein